ncbi:MAG: efflux transporter outer membrane subunit [Magnetospirillum gryphiswaldense]|nr:efflux transporter outer membrane subunit [Magnetospirillum gryphiswaldense]
MNKIILMTCAAALLSGCTLIPDLDQPALPVTKDWATGPASGKVTEAKDGQVLWGDTQWQSFFPDTTLQSLIGAALDNNRDLRVAALNIEVARASYRISEADLFPTLDANAAETVKRTSRNASTSTPKAASTARTTSANLSTSFEIDLFGRLRSLEAQALEKYLATEQARDTTRIALIAEVANAYLTLLGDRKLMALTEETLATRVKSLELIQASFDRGISSELDLAQARSAVETARVNRAKYLRQVDQDKNALTLLVGAPLTEEQLAGDLDKMVLVADLPVGMPSDVLLRRPDIANAEHSLRAANANIGAARAAFFPSISLTGSLGYASTNLSSLFGPGSGAWSFGPSISMPIFDMGANQAGLDSAKASRDIAVAQYEKAIQTAFREVSDALAAKGTLTDQMNAQQSLVNASATSTRLSQARYDRGIDSYLNVLDSQRSLYSAQQDLVSVRVSRLSNLVTLYKVLGGGRS